MSKNIPDNSIIMGIDPGTNIMGFGIIKITGKKHGTSRFN
jgi:predicted RNase H-like nuclease (RuvC/YqgF family)